MTLSPRRGVSPALSSSVVRDGRRRGPFNQPDRSVDPRLRLARPRLGASPEPRQFAPGQVPPGRLRARRVFLSFRLGFEVGRVAALVDVRPTPVELEHPGGQPVEQVPIVRHQDQTPAEGQEALLEPGHRPQIEMVGGLIEHEELGRMGQHPGQGHPLGLTPGQLPHVHACSRRPSRGARARPRPPSPPRRPLPPCPAGRCGTCSRNPTREPRPRRT